MKPKAVCLLLKWSGREGFVEDIGKCFSLNVN